MRGALAIHASESPAVSCSRLIPNWSSPVARNRDLPCARVGCSQAVRQQVGLAKPPGVQWAHAGALRPYRLGSVGIDGDRASADNGGVRETPGAGDAAASLRPLHTREVAGSKPAAPIF